MLPGQGTSGPVAWPGAVLGSPGGHLAVPPTWTLSPFSTSSPPGIRSKGPVRVEQRQEAAAASEVAQRTVSCGTQATPTWDVVSEAQAGGWEEVFPVEGSVEVSKAEPPEQAGRRHTEGGG